MDFKTFVTENADSFEWDDQGRLLIEIGSNMLPGVTVDTYSTFTGENHSDYIVSDFAELCNWLDHPMGRNVIADVEWDDFDFDYDHKKVLEELSETAAEGLWAEYEFITDYKVKDTYSPGAYNFATDSFQAVWTIDIDALNDACEDIDVAGIEEWALKTHESYSGFHSWVPGYFESEYEWAVVWAYINRILMEDEYDGMYHVFESETEIYDNACTFTIKPSAYRTVYRELMGEEAPESVTDEDSLLEALPPYQEEVLF